jgi:hypothetical protein
MRRPITIALLALGTILGYGFAFHAMRHHGYYHDGYGYDGWCDHHHDRWGRAPDQAPPKPEPPKPETPAPQ